jgi:hypothetical protein
VPKLLAAEDSGNGIEKIREKDARMQVAKKPILAVFPYNLGHSFPFPGLQPSILSLSSK